MIHDVPTASLILPAQVLGELFNVLVRKVRRAPIDAQKAIQVWQDAYLIVPTSEVVLTQAIELSVSHNLTIWDGVILSAASLARCQILLSEDMHEGFAWGGVTIVNPFASPPHRLLNELRR